MAGYVEITLDEFKQEIEGEMGFTCINANKGSMNDTRGGYAEEYIYERVVKHNNPEDMMWQYVSNKSNTCPTCKSLLVKRTAKRTKKQFLGCSNYPECKHTQNI